MKKSRKIEPYLYILPAMLYFTVFSFYPFLKTIGLTFFTVNANGQVKAFAGFDNYIHVLTDTAFLRSVWNTLVYVVLIALILAVLANKKTRTSAVYETMFSLTMAMSMSVTAMIFKIMYNPNIGLINKILHVKINWLNDPEIAMVSVSLISVWLNIGFNFLFLLAAIRGVPGELLESANIDGANLYQKVRSVILPLISPTIFFLICSSLAKNIIMAGLPIILTEGGPKGSTSTMIYYMYKQAFGNMSYNDAYAAAVITFLFTLIAMLVSFSFEKKGVHYS